MSDITKDYPLESISKVYMQGIKDFTKESYKLNVVLQLLINRLSINN